MNINKISKENRKHFVETHNNLFRFADCLGDKHVLTAAGRWFSRDRNLSKDEKKLIILNWLNLWESTLRTKRAFEVLYLYESLIQLAALFERLKGISGFHKKVVDRLPIDAKTYETVWEFKS